MSVNSYQKGIIHRDLKPSNILVAAGGDKAIPKIIDFGVAKAISQPLTERTLRTEERRLLGTPEYMSPEQADMASEDIDTRSDVYSLGVLLQVLLTGVLPFDAKALREHGIEHVRKTIRETDPMTPSARLAKLGDEAKAVAENRRTQVAALAKRLHSELEWIPLKAMRKDRAERYRSASELADDIENYLKGAPLIAGPPGSVYRLRKFVGRHGTLSTAVLAVAVSLILGLIATTAMYLRAERARHREARALAESQAVTAFLRDDVLGVVSDANAHEQSISYILDAASGNLEGKFEGQPLVEATIRGTLGWTYHGIDKREKARPHLEIALRLYEAELGEDHPKTKKAMHNLGWVYMRMGRLEDAERLFSRLYPPEHENAEERGLLQRGYLYYKLGKYREAEACYRKGIARSQREEGRIPRWTCANLAEMYLVMGRYKDAEEMDLLALSVWPPNDRSRNYKRRNLADAYRGQGRYQEAEELYLTTLVEQQQMWGKRDSVFTMLGLAELYMDLGDNDKADEWFVRIQETVAASQETEEDVWESAGPQYCDSLAVLRTRQGDFSQAEDLFEKAQAGWMRQLKEWADEDPKTLVTIHGLGVLRREQQRYEEAESLLRRALEARQSKLGRGLPPCLESMHELAVLSLRQARYNEAEALLLQAYNGREAKLGPEHRRTLDSLRELVHLYESWNKPDEAAQWRAKLPQVGDVEKQN